jgi:hypothetical protein
MTISRRRFLRGSSGVVLGLPFLELFAPRKASAQTVPKRVLILATGFSMDVDRSNQRDAFWASGNATDIGTLSPMLEPFTPYSSQITLVGGVNNNVAPLMESNGHNASGKTLLASYPVKNAFDSSGNFSQGAECEHGSEIAGPSIDHYLASRLGSRLLALSVGPVNGEHKMRWQQVGNSVVFDEGHTNPQTVFNDLFGQRTAPMAEPTPLELLRARRGSVLDGVLDQFRAVSQRAGAADRARLEQHADLVRSVERDVDQVIQIVCDDPQLNLPANWSSVSLRDEDGLYDDVLLRVMGRLSALSLSCQATQVASIHLRNMQTNTFPWLAGGSPYIPANWHAVVHMDDGSAEQRPFSLPPSWRPFRCPPASASPPRTPRPPPAPRRSTSRRKPPTSSSRGSMPSSASCTPN